MLYIPSMSFICHQRILFIIHFFFKFQQNNHRLKLQFCQFQFFLHGFLVQIFLSFQLQCKEVVLDANDIAKAIIDYVVHESIDKLVLGASSRNAFSRSCFFFFFLIPTPNLSLSKPNLFYYSELSSMRMYLHLFQRLHQNFALCT